MPKRPSLARSTAERPFPPPWHPPGGLILSLSYTTHQAAAMSRIKPALEAHLGMPLLTPALRLRLNFLALSPSVRLMWKTAFTTTPYAAACKVPSPSPGIYLGYTGSSSTARVWALSIYQGPFFCRPVPKLSVTSCSFCISVQQGLTLTRGAWRRYAAQEVQVASEDDRAYMGEIGKGGMKGLLGEYFGTTPFVLFEELKPVKANAQTGFSNFGPGAAAGTHPFTFPSVLPRPRAWKVDPEPGGLRRLGTKIGSPPPEGCSGSAGVPTRPAGDTGDGSWPDSGIPAPTHSLAGDAAGGGGSSGYGNHGGFSGGGFNKRPRNF